MPTHTGGCHCGRVRFRGHRHRPSSRSRTATVPSAANSGILHLIMPALRIASSCISGREALSTYSFNTHIAKHFFCSTCGVKSFYVPRSHPDGISVNDALHRQRHPSSRCPSSRSTAAIGRKVERSIETRLSLQCGA